MRTRMSGEPARRGAGSPEGGIPEIASAAAARRPSLVPADTEQDPARETRERLARDLHDAVLQVLAAAALHLRVASQLVATDPREAAARCDAAAALIEAQQLDVRAMIRDLRSANRPPLAAREMATRLEHVGGCCGRDWGLQVAIVFGGQGVVPGHLVGEIESIVREALTNVARHAGARTARVALHVARDRVRLRIVDDGCGFPYRGRFDLAALIAQGVGPASLRERVAALQGELTLVSGESGSSLAISIPTEEEPRRRCA